MVVGTSYAALSSTQDTMVASCWEDLELKVRYHKTDEEKEPQEVQQCLCLSTLNVVWGSGSHIQVWKMGCFHTHLQRERQGTSCAHNPASSSLETIIYLLASELIKV